MKITGDKNKLKLDIHGNMYMNNIPINYTIT